MRRGLPRPLFLLVGAALIGSACVSTTSASSDVNVIRSTTSFGFCLGYCRTTLEVTPNGIVFVEEETRPGGLPPVRRTAAISDAEWRQLTSAVDRQAIESLPPTVGCPDCADGGAESVEIVATDWRDQVTFEFNVSPPGLQLLLTHLRALRERFPPTEAPR
jgi:hypothetical protein